MHSKFLNYIEQQSSLDNLTLYSQKFEILENNILDLPTIENYSQEFKDEIDLFFEEFEEPNKKSKKNLAEYLELILSRIKTNTFTFEPFVEKRFRRGEKTRVINILAPKDKIIDHICFKYLEVLRDCKSTKSIYKISIAISEYLKTNEVYFLRTDVKDFFDSIDHKILLDIIKKENDESLSFFIESFLKTKKNKKSKLNNKGKVPFKDYIGIPQGAAISQALSNIYLKDIDNHLNENALRNGDLYFRYVDDICYLSKDEHTITNTLKYLNDKLESIGLSINRKKQKAGKVLYGFDYLGFHHSARGISLSKKSLNLIMSNYYNYYKNYLKNSSLYINQNSTNKSKIWRHLSIAINSSIRGFNHSWKGNNSKINGTKNKIIEKNVYGIARHLSILTNTSQIKLLEKWLGNINKYFCYKICKTNKLSKTFIELESILNWYYRYKSNYHSAIQNAYSRYLDSIYPKDYPSDVENVEYLKIIIPKEEKIIDENWESIPDDIRIS